MTFPPLVIGELKADIPIIQGGMGIGISLARLAGNVAKEGGIGILSTAQIGYQRADFERSPFRANMAAIQEQYEAARSIAPHGILGFNIMVASSQYERYVTRCVEVGADVIISGAGLPIQLPELVAGSTTKIAPILSSNKAARILLKTWKKRYERTADFIVIEGPKAGGHLGFKPEELAISDDAWDLEVQAILATVQSYEAEFDQKIPVIIAGGIFDKSDIAHYLAMGCEGVQMATRFVVTEECDAPEDYKQRYLDAKKEDMTIIKSPVGLPGRAIMNQFAETIKTAAIPIAKCRSCLSKKHCNRKNIPYCISEALLNAVEGRTDKALLFAGENAYRLTEKTTVKQLLHDLAY